MPRGFAPSKKDGNQKANDAACERMGLTVWDTSALGKGFPDAIIAGYNLHIGAIMQVLVEWKMPGEKQTDKELAFAKKWPGALLIVTDNPETVGRWFGVIE